MISCKLQSVKNPNNHRSRLPKQQKNRQPTEKPYPIPRDKGTSKFRKSRATERFFSPVLPRQRAAVSRARLLRNEPQNRAVDDARKVTRRARGCERQRRTGLWYLAKVPSVCVYIGIFTGVAVVFVEKYVWLRRWLGYRWSWADRESYLCFSWLILNFVWCVIITHSRICEEINPFFFNWQKFKNHLHRFTKY